MFLPLSQEACELCTCTEVTVLSLLHAGCTWQGLAEWGGWLSAPVNFPKEKMRQEEKGGGSVGFIHAEPIHKGGGACLLSGPLSLTAQKPPPPESQHISRIGQSPSAHPDAMRSSRGKRMRRTEGGGYGLSLPGVCGSCSTRVFSS